MTMTKECTNCGKELEIPVSVKEDGDKYLVIDRDNGKKEDVYCSTECMKQDEVIKAL